MNALLGISLWIALATVVPGLVTLAVVYLCLAAAGVEMPAVGSDWVMAGLAVTAMVLTQALGILLEGLLIKLGWLGGREQEVSAPDPGAPGRFVKVGIKPYEQYEGLYVVLARLSGHDDAQGHLKRALAQFFLSVNTLVSFGAGAVLAFGLALGRQAELAYLGLVLLLALGISYWVAIIRFREMAKSLWAVQTYPASAGGDAGDPESG